MLARLLRFARNDERRSAIARSAATKQSRRTLFSALVFLLLVLPAAAAVSWSQLTGVWPDPALLGDIPGIAVSWPSNSPFAPEDIGADPEDNPPTTALGRLYLPPGVHAPRSVPAVILLHGSGGILSSRESTYAPQLARMGIAALVVDSFGARRDRGTAFIDRLLSITETMILADAYSGLAFLAARPEIDPKRVVLTGFSYGAMAAMYGIYAQVADRLAPPAGGAEGLRFAGHVAFYGPCIARFENSRTTGAPLLMLLGGADEITDQQRCAEVAADLRAGGSRVDTIVYPTAVHQWDGGFGHRLIGRNLGGCSLRVERDGTIRDLHTGLAMTGPFSRKIILGMCTLFARAYPIGRDDAVRARSNADWGRFMASIFARVARPGGS
jgi:dienelactone hydrolase